MVGLSMVARATPCLRSLADGVRVVQSVLRQCRLRKHTYSLIIPSFLLLPSCFFLLPFLLPPSAYTIRSTWFARLHPHFLSKREVAAVSRCAPAPTPRLPCLTHLTPCSRACPVCFSSYVRALFLSLWCGGVGRVLLWCVLVLCCAVLCCASGRSRRWRDCCATCFGLILPTTPVLPTLNRSPTRYSSSTVICDQGHQLLVVCQIQLKSLELC